MSDFTATRPYSYTTLSTIDPNQNNLNETTLYGKFNGAINATTGHGHTGAVGDGPVITVAGGGTGATTAPLARTALGLNSQLGWFRNISITRATTTNAGDSVKITSGDGTALSSTNYGTVFLPSTVTAGLVVEFTVTSDVTILLTGAHFGIGTTGDITGGLLRILACNDNGSLKWCVAYLGGRNTLLTTDTTATPSSVTLQEKVLCNSAISSSSNTCREIGFVRANFDDTGGAAEDLWAIQSGVNDCVTGQIADGLWQPWNPGYGGFSANPTTSSARWTMIGRMITLTYSYGSSGTSSTGSFDLSLPAKSGYASTGLGVTNMVNNGVGLTTVGDIVLTAGGTSMSLRRDGGGTTWTNSGAKGGDVGNFSYEVGPVASFIE